MFAGLLFGGAIAKATLLTQRDDIASLDASLDASV
jgi:hypothetical protein